MTRSDEKARRTVRIEVEGRTLAEADVEPGDEPGVVYSDLHVESGPIPGDTGARLVDAVLEHPDVSSAERLVATMPMGDTTMLDRVRQRTRTVEVRPAGATKIVHARLRKTGGAAEEGAAR
jgi:hypothetical protein